MTTAAADTFKRPPSPSQLPSLSGQRPKRTRARVLDEDDYVDRVSHIIERDFFPELEKLEARAEYIDATERNDVATMSRLRERYSSSTGPVRHQGREGSPDTFETPLESRREEAEEQELGRVPPPTAGPSDSANASQVKQLSLDQFMATHTSEDNASFDEIMDESKKKFMLDHSWMFKEEETLSIELKEQQLRLPSIEQQQGEFEKVSKKLEGWTYKNVNSVFYIPDGVPLSDLEEIDRAKKERKIVIENTRFKTNPWKTELQNSTLKASVANKQVKEMGKVGVDGKEASGHHTPSVNGFKFLRMTPSPMHSSSESPLMTWGEVESTPYRLEGCETPLPMNTRGGPSFSIQEMPKRDRLAYELAEKNSKFYRDKKGKAIQKARSNIRTPNMNLSGRVATMSPAVQKLLGVRLGTDKALRASYTPSPARSSTTSLRSGMEVTPNRSSKKVISASIRSKAGTTPRTPATASASDLSSLTDDLLNIPTSSSVDSAKTSRVKAADFL